MIWIVTPLERESNEIWLVRVVVKGIEEKTAASVGAGMVDESINCGEGCKTQARNTIGTVTKGWVLGRGNINIALRSDFDTAFGIF